MAHRDVARALLALPILLFSVSCTDAAVPTATRAEPTGEASGSIAGGRLLTCPSADVQTVTGTIGMGGGRLGVNGHELYVPKGAISSPQRFHIEVRSSPYLVVSFRAEGHEHFEFRSPAVLTLNYSRCEADAESTGDLRVYYVDAASLSILEDVGGAVDTGSNSLTALTDHLSDYAVGSPQ